MTYNEATMMPSINLVKSPLVSVVIPTYNRPYTLKVALEKLGQGDAGSSVEMLLSLIAEGHQSAQLHLNLAV